MWSCKSAIAPVGAHLSLRCLRSAYRPRSQRSPQSGANSRRTRRVGNKIRKYPFRQLVGNGRAQPGKRLWRGCKPRVCGQPSRKQEPNSRSMPCIVLHQFWRTGKEVDVIVMTDIFSTMTTLPPDGRDGSNRRRVKALVAIPWFCYNETTILTISSIKESPL